MTMRTKQKQIQKQLGLAAAAAMALALAATPASAEITQDCILVGTVDMRTAQRLGQPVYVNFKSARRGTEAGCSMSRRGNSRRVQFITAPEMDALQNVTVDHGDTVRYRYIERDNQQGSWELVDIRS